MTSRNVNEEVVEAWIMLRIARWSFVNSADREKNEPQDCRSSSGLDPKDRLRPYVIHGGKNKSWKLRNATGFFRDYLRIFSTSFSKFVSLLSLSLRSIGSQIEIEWEKKKDNVKEDFNHYSSYIFVQFIRNIWMILDSIFPASTHQIFPLFFPPVSIFSLQSFFDKQKRNSFPCVFFLLRDIFLTFRARKISRLDTLPSSPSLYRACPNPHFRACALRAYIYVVYIYIEE